MIDIATSVAAPIAKGAIAAAAKAATGDFKSAMVSVAGKDAAPSDAKADAPLTDLPAPAPADTTPYTDLVLFDLSGKRQRIAGGGKDVPPKSPPIVEPEEDASKDVIWSPVAMLLPTPTPVTPIALPTQGGAAAPVFADSGPSILVDPATVAVASADVVAKPLPSVGEQVRQTAPVAVESVAVPIAAKIDLPIRIDATPAPTPQPSAAGPVTQLAGQAFAAAIAAVVQSHRDEREPTDAKTPLSLAAAALEAVHKPAVAATADAKQGALDLRQDSGLQCMIDRIETLRDDANARDTRIRLVPDALGAVDVSVRKDGERVHVHFAAENQASARLLSDAQPRLADLAEARGVKLGQTSVGSGTDSNAGNARQQQPNSILPAAPAAILAAAAADITDTRIA